MAVQLTPDGPRKKAMEVMEARMGLAVQRIVREVKLLLNIGGGSLHAPSNEGEPPHKQTARLFNSIAPGAPESLSGVERTDTKVIGTVGTDVVYARRLELGFVGIDAAGRNVHQGPRPYLRPGWAGAKTDVKKILGAK